MNNTASHYEILRAVEGGPGSFPQLDTYPELAIDQFHPAGSGHRPRVTVRIGWNTWGLFLHFHVLDQYVIARRKHYQDPVCRDSCVEFFVRPRTNQGYINFEVNCAGVMLSQFVEDWRRTPDGFVKFSKIPSEAASQVCVSTTFHEPILKEISDPVAWEARLSIPHAFFTPYLGDVTPSPGDKWRANLYKCADDSSHPHWASWSPIGDELSFHQPDRFGTLVFRE